METNCANSAIENHKAQAELATDVQSCGALGGEKIVLLEN
jgi:hypothetical protein